MLVMHLSSWFSLVGTLVAAEMVQEASAGVVRQLVRRVQVDWSHLADKEAGRDPVPPLPEPVQLAVVGCCMHVSRKRICLGLIY